MAIDGGGGDEGEVGVGKVVEEVLGAAQKDVSISVGAAATGGGGQEDVGGLDVLGEGLDGGGVGEVAGEVGLVS